MDKFIFTIMILFSAVPSCAQISTSADQKIFSAQVSLVDEFFRRFNREEAHPLVQEGSENAERNNLLMLLDYANYKSKTDSAYQVARSFVDTVMDNSVKINYCDSNWIAIAECHGTLSGKTVDFTLHLQVEQRREKMYKWTIVSARGDIFNLDNQNQHEPFMLMPDDHETNFMSLHRMTSETYAYITDFVGKGTKVDKLSVFMTLVKLGILKIDYVSELSFMLFQVPGYIFTIKNVNRNTQNSGWLISKILPVSEQEKLDIYNYMKRQL